MTTQNAKPAFPTREFLEQFARNHALLVGDAPKTHRQQALEHIRRTRAFRDQAQALMNQIESGQASASKRNLKKLNAICKHMTDALAEGWSLYQTTLTLESMGDPDYLSSLQEDWPPSPEDFDPDTVATVAASTAHPQALPQQIKKSITSGLADNPMLLVEQIQQHLAQN